jgi:hypothetical protein
VSATIGFANLPERVLQTVRPVRGETAKVESGPPATAREAILPQLEQVAK